MKSKRALPSFSRPYFYPQSFPLFNSSDDADELGKRMPKKSKVTRTINMRGQPINFFNSSTNLNKFLTSKSCKL